MPDKNRAQALTLTRTSGGKPVDPAELARIRQQREPSWAGVLTPPQIEDFFCAIAERDDDPL